jgi:hypothetical protein
MYTFLIGKTYRNVYCFFFPEIYFPQHCSQQMKCDSEMDIWDMQVPSKSSQYWFITQKYESVTLQLLT